MKCNIICLAAAALLAGCGNAGGNSATAADAAIDASMEAMPWTGFYERAGQLFQQGQRDEAVTLFYVGQLRGRIVVQCQDVQPDREPALLASFNATLGQTINEYAGGSPEGWAAAIDRALAYDAEHPDPNAASAECRAERERQRAGLTELRDQIRANPEEIRRQRTANGLPNR